MSTALDALVQQSSEMMIILGESTEVEFASSSAARLFGFDPVALVGASIGAFVDPADIEQCSAALGAVGVDCVEQMVPLAIIRPDGEIHECDVIVRPLLEGSRRQGWLLTSTDTSTATALASARGGDVARFLESASCSPFVMFRLDDKGACVYLNERWSILTGQTLEEALGRGWLSAVDDGDRKTFRAITGAAHMAGRGWRHTFRIRHRDGSTRWAEAAADPIRTPDGSDAMIGVVVDISAEVRLQRVATSV